MYTRARQVQLIATPISIVRSIVIDKSNILLTLTLLLYSCLGYAQLDCSSAVVLTEGITYMGNTSGGDQNVSTYNNDPWWQLTGPEIIHEIEWPGGFMSIALTNKTAALDLILVRQCDNNNFLYSGGGNSGLVDSYIEEQVAAGTYQIVVDGWDGAEGTYDLLITRSHQVEVFLDGSLRRFLLEQNIVYELINGNWEFLIDNVEKMEANWGFVTNPSTGAGEDSGVLSITLIGERRARMLFDGNFDRGYYKQRLDCSQTTLSLFGDIVYAGSQEILTGCDILRCENGYIVAHLQDGSKKLYDTSTSTSWTNIDQIITIDGISYYIKQSDRTIWELDTPHQSGTQIAGDAALLQDNDNQLISINLQGDYSRWNGQQWSAITPNFTSVSPSIIDEGMWFFIQSKVNLESADNVAVTHKQGLTIDEDGQIIMDLIPAEGSCESYLWAVQEREGGTLYLINKAMGSNRPLQVTVDGILTMEPDAGVATWNIALADVTRYGTNAYHLITTGDNTAITFDSEIGTSVLESGSTNQTWVLQFNQLARDYFLPIPTLEVLQTHYTDNPAINLEQDIDEITRTYRRFLKSENDTYVLGTHTTSDWAVVNYYLTINNMMLAVNDPKPSDPAVDPSLIQDLSAMAGQNLIIISKDDTNAEVPNHYFTQGFPTQSVASLRGSAGYNAARKWILISEELTCKTGITNRPLDDDFRRFDHGVHEFTHALQELCNWIAIIDANDMCPNEPGRSSECFCFDVQAWFNSIGSDEYYPGLRAFNEDRAQFMEKIFDPSNTWMPTKDLRTNGYNPSGPTVSDACSSDTTPPEIIDCPDDVSLTLDLDNQTMWSVTDPLFQDECPILSQSLTITYSGGSTALDGSTSLTLDYDPATTRQYSVTGSGIVTFEYEVIDQSGNVATCTITYTMVAATGPCVDDVEDPVLINCPNGASVPIVDDRAIINFTAPTASDNCAIDRMESSFTYSNGSTNQQGDTLSIFPSITPGTGGIANIYGAGNLTIAFTAYDPAGNSATCSVDYTANILPTSVVFAAVESCIDAGATINLPIQVRNFDSITDFRFDLQLQGDSRLRFEGIDNASIDNITSTAQPNGAIRIEWADVPGSSLSLPDNTSIVDLVITADADYDMPTRITAANVDVTSLVSTTSTVFPIDICVAGRVTPSGRISTATGFLQSDVAVDLLLNNTVSQQTTTDATGQYVFAITDDVAQIYPSKSDEIRAGISIVDVARIRRHFLQQDLLDSDYQLVAADVNKDGTIDISDVDFNNRVLLRKEDSFANNAAWRFIPAQLDISADPLDVDLDTTIRLDDMGLDFNNLDFVSIKTGDVDHSALSQDSTSVMNGQQISISIPDTITDPAASIRLPVLIDNSQDLSLLTGRLTYDDTHLRLLGVESTLLDGFSGANYNNLGGEVLLAWDHPQGQAVENGATLLTLVLESVTGTGVSTVTLEDVKAYDADYAAFETTTTSGSINFRPSSNVEVSSLLGVTVQPNPFVEATSIHIKTSTPQAIKLVITDLSGKVLREVSLNKESSHHDYEVSDISTKGVLLVHLQGRDFTEVVKLIRL